MAIFFYLYRSQFCLYKVKCLAITIKGKVKFGRRVEMEEKILGYEQSNLEAWNGIYTAKEIHQQPDVWLKVLHQISTHKEVIQSFLDQVLEHEDLEIILTGAGTSAFAGEVVEPYLHQLTKKSVRAIATTDIVANPFGYLSPEKPTLLISYARSGNSPESVATVQLAKQLVRHLYQIVITCNKEGKLAQFASEDEGSLLLLMPDETNDMSFAMTSSCTSMILTNIAIFNLKTLHNLQTDLFNVRENLLDLFNNTDLFNEILTYDYDRLIFLGSGPLKGIAREMALKTLELTAGIVNANYDTPLGFRHGPKSVINDKTLIVVLKNNQTYPKYYDEDLIRELLSERKENKVLVLCNDHVADDSIYFGRAIKNNVILGMQYLAFGQILALKKSLSLGITPDNPCPTGEVNRVVKGVTIYQFKEEKGC